MKQFTSPSQKLGKLGEDIAVRSLKKGGYMILDQNVTRSCGEIDIVAKKDNTLCFIEVKAVSADLSRYKNDNLDDIYNPFENIHPKKLAKFLKTVELYLYEKQFCEDTEIPHVVNGVAVYIDEVTKEARVRVLENIV